MPFAWKPFEREPVGQVDRLPVLAHCEPDPCDGCDGNCGDVCPVYEAKRLNAERERCRDCNRLVRQLAEAVDAERAALRFILEANQGDPERSLPTLAAWAEARLHELGGQ